MRFTSDEIQFIESHILKLEKQARLWKTQKIIAIICFIVGIGFLITVGRLAPRLHETTKLLYYDHLPSDSVNFDTMQKYVNLESRDLRVEFNLFLRAILIAGLGTGLFVWTLSNRNKDKQDLLLAKFLKNILKDNKEGNTPPTSLSCSESVLSSSFEKAT